MTSNAGLEAAPSSQAHVTRAEGLSRSGPSTPTTTYYYDNVTVSIVPEKKGLFLKHSEYEIRCLKQNFCVYRRYNDFINLQSFLISNYPYRLITRLPPKQLMMDSLLEDRRRGLQNFLKILSAHPLLSQSPVLRTFLTDNSAEYQDHLRESFNSEADEFSRLSSDVDLPLEDQGRLAVNRENMRRMLGAISKLIRLVDNQMHRTQQQAKEMEEISVILRSSNSSEIFPTDTFARMADGCHNVSVTADRFATMQLRSIGERFVILLEVLNGHSDLCDRVEKGIVAEHQKALSKMLTLNKQKIKGVIRGTAADNVNALHEREVVQTGVVGKLGRRSAFSLYCILQETSMAQQYLQSVPSILLSFCHEQQLGNSELANAWTKIVAEETQQLNK